MASLILVGLMALSQIKVWNVDQNDFHVARNSNAGPVDTATRTESDTRHAKIVRNQPRVLERYVVDNANLTYAVVIDPITDDELIAWMQLAGKPAFLGRIDGQLRLIEY